MLIEVFIFDAASQIIAIVIKIYAHFDVLVLPYILLTGFNLSVLLIDVFDK